MLKKIQDNFTKCFPKTAFTPSIFLEKRYQYSCKLSIELQIRNPDNSDQDLTILPFADQDAGFSGTKGAVILNRKTSIKFSF